MRERTCRREGALKRGSGGVEGGTSEAAERGCDDGGGREN